MVELEVLPACRDYGLAVIPWSPLGSGVLAGAKGTEKAGRRAEGGVKDDFKKHAWQIEKYEKFCKNKGEKPADLALAWLLANPVVTAPIIGPRTMEQLTGSLRALKIKFSKADMEELDTIWPGPGGEAPEAFAW
jgi:aryl-alcohol dehydrogenase-like predicted oxidoreductase